MYGLVLALVALSRGKSAFRPALAGTSCLAGMLVSTLIGNMPFNNRVRKEMVMRRSMQKKDRPFGAQVAFARAATGLGWMSLGALAVGATATGAVAIGALAIRALAVRRGRIGRLEIDELEVGRLRVKELVVEQRQEGERA